MKLTKKQLRKLIAESFIGAPDGTVYTQRTKRVHSEEGEAFGGGAADEMDIPVVYGEDHTKEATPKLYGILTRNRHEIHNFHKKGPYIYKTLMNPDTDPDNKKYFLSLLWQSEIITDKALEDASFEIDLLTSPDFKDFRDQSAERLERKHQYEMFTDIKKQRLLYKNPEYVKWAKKQIDKVVDGGFEYFKDAIQEIFYHDMYDYKYKGHAPRKIGYNPDEGISTTDFVDENLFAIGGLLGAYKGFNKTEDAAFYNTKLDDYTNDKSHDLSLVAIDALVGANLLEKTDDGKVRMPAETYQIMLNNERGRIEDFNKEKGIRSAFLDDPYKPNPNLPVVTEAMIRQMIREAMFSPRAARAIARGKVQQSIPTGKMSKLDNMLDSEDEETAIQGHSFLDTLGDYDSPTGDSYQDIRDFDQQMDDAMADQRKRQMIDDWEKYMAAAGPEVESVVNKLIQPGVDLYVVSLGDDYQTFKAPGSDVVRRPEDFGLMAISSPFISPDGFSFADEIGDLMGTDFEGDDMDAILIFLEALAGDNNIGHVPEDYQFSPEHAFLAWITENNPNLRIFVDP
jgi:hypothetical protein